MERLNLMTSLKSQNDMNFMRASQDRSISGGTSEQANRILPNRMIASQDALTPTRLLRQRRAATASNGALDLRKSSISPVRSTLGILTVKDQVDRVVKSRLERAQDELHRAR